MGKKDKLTPKQVNFCKWYVVTRNGTQAAIKAGYSAKAAKETASRLLTKVNVLNFIEEEQKKVPDNIPDKDAILQFFKHLMYTSEKETVRMNAAIQIAKIQGFYRNEWD